MVRRWSYIDSTLLHADLTPVSRGHRFKVFKKNTKFKRFNRGLIDFVRRKNIKRKRYINFITLSYLSSSWAKHYLQQRSLFRSMQTFNIANYGLTSLYYNTVVKLSSKNNINLGINTLSLPSKRASYLIDTNCRAILGLNSGYFNRNSITYTNKFNLNSDKSMSIGLTKYVEASSKFFLSRDTNLIKAQTDIYSSTLSSIINYVECHRKIMVLLSLMNTQNKL